MDATTQIEAVVKLLRRLGIDVRREHLGGGGGGRCVVRGRQIFFIDLDADVATRLEYSLRALAELPRLEEIYVAPALRELIEKTRK